MYESDFEDSSSEGDPVEEATKLAESTRKLANDADKWFQMALEGKSTWNKHPESLPSKKENAGGGHDIYARIQRARGQQQQSIKVSKPNAKGVGLSRSLPSQKKPPEAGIKVPKANSEVKGSSGLKNTNELQSAFYKGGYASLLEDEEAATVQKEASEVAAALSRPSSSLPNRLAFDFQAKSYNSIALQNLRWAKLGQDAGLKEEAFGVFQLDSFSLEKLRPFNTMHASTIMTDDGIEEEVQTEDASTMDKWTQKNPCWSSDLSCSDLWRNHQESVGVGCVQGRDEFVRGQSVSLERGMKNRSGLNAFASRSSHLIIGLMELGRRRSGGGGNSNSTLVFNRAHSALDILESHLLATSGDLVACSNRPQASKGNNDKGIQGCKSIVTVWSVKEPSLPRHLLRVWGRVTALELDMDYGLVVAGSEDGSLSIWSLNDLTTYQKRMHTTPVLSPSINTSCLEMTGIRGGNHITPILALQIMKETRICAQIVSLDEERKVILWSCLCSESVDIGSDRIIEQGAAWTKLRLTIRNILPLGSNLDLLSFHGWTDSIGSHLVFGTNKGSLATINLWAQTPSLVEIPSSVQGVVRCSTLALNPQMGIVAGGCEDGYTRIFSLSRSCELVSLPCKGVPLRVLWSLVRISLLFVATESRIELWDLLESDSIAWRSVTIKGLTEFVIYRAETEYFAKMCNSQVTIDRIPGKEIKCLTERDKDKLVARLGQYA